MKRFSLANSAALAFMFGSIVAMAGPVNASAATNHATSSAVACTAYSSYAFPGGYLVEQICNGRLVAGLGSTRVAADANTRSFGEFGSLSGRYCRLDRYDVKAMSGGYIATFFCEGSGLSSGLGTTATDTGINALGFAQLQASSGRRCVTDSTRIRVFPGGYHVEFYCYGSGLISGIGTTATAAGVNALGFAKHEALAGGRCATDTTRVWGFQGGYLIDFFCDGQQFSGVGTTATDAAQNALDFTSYEAIVGRRCFTDRTRIRAFAGRYEVQFICSSAIVTGVGSTATLAAQDALVKANAQWPAN